MVELHKLFCAGGAAVNKTDKIDDFTADTLEEDMHIHSINLIKTLT